jgi:hypothetical protein
LYKNMQMQKKCIKKPEKISFSDGAVSHIQLEEI